MKRIAIVSLVLLLMAAAYQAGDIIKADRFVVFNHQGNPSIVAMTGNDGGGEFMVYDAEGQELFGIRNGQFVGQLGSELKRINKSIKTTPTVLTQAAPNRLMQLESIETLPVDQSMLREAAELNKRASAFESSARGYERQIALSVGSGEASKKQRSGYRKLKASAEQEAKRLRAKAIRLERQANEPRQILQGWDGKRIVILETTRDLSTVITRVAPGDFLTWRGERIEMSDTFDRFEVSSIEKSPRPLGFIQQP